MIRLLEDMVHTLAHVIRETFAIVRSMPTALVDMVRAMPTALDDIDILVILAGWLTTIALLAWALTG